MFSRSTLAHKVRLILAKGLMALGALWVLRIILPILALAVVLIVLLVGIGVGGYRLWHCQQRRYQAQLRYEDRLARQFYVLLQRREGRNGEDRDGGGRVGTGRVSALEFAMHTRITPARAQRYLYEQAQAFGAYFERTIHGDIVYIFNLAMVFGLPSSQVATPAERTPAEVAWAEVESTQWAQLQESNRLAHQNQTHQKAEAIARQLRAIKIIKSAQSEPLDSVQPGTLPTVRGRAQATPSYVRTINVSAVNK